MNPNNNQGQNQPKNLNNQKKGPGKKKGFGFSAHFGTTILFFLVVIAVYSIVSEKSVKVENVPFSQVASEVRAGSVKQITVSADKLEVVKNDDTKLKSKKES